MPYIPMACGINIIYLVYHAKKYYNIEPPNFSPIERDCDKGQNKKSRIN